MSGRIYKKKISQQSSLFEIEPISSESHRRVYSEMYCDGASSGNPGKSGIGVVIKVSDKDVGQLGINNKYIISEYIGVTTNNMAEYMALIRGLEKARSLGIKKIKIYLDSELLVRQMTGIYKVKSKKLMPLWTQARDMIDRGFDRCTITHIPRELNKEADSLARKAVRRAG
jgi:ribonuclease HI